MSYTNETVHFSIPLPLGSDLTTPMDYNPAFEAIDAAIFEAQTNASQATSDASNAVETANNAASAVGDLGGDVNSISGRVTALEESDIIKGNKIDNLETKMPTKFDSVGIADAYINGLTYAVGDVVTYNGQRYVCNTAVTAAEPFDADKWTAKDIQAELDQLSVKSKTVTLTTSSGTAALTDTEFVNATCLLYVSVPTAIAFIYTRSDGINHGVKVCNIADFSPVIDGDHEVTVFYI